MGDKRFQDFAPERYDRYVQDGAVNLRFVTGSGGSEQGREEKREVVA